LRPVKSNHLPRIITEKGTLRKSIILFEEMALPHFTAMLITESVLGKRYYSNTVPFGSPGGKK
jgi:hypothetical protein